MTPRPIETHYNGYRFRSRLEARWAVFFDALGMPYAYEKEGYDLGEAGWYLPDFWLPEQRAWVETKGDRLTLAETNKMKALARGTGQPVWVFAGTPDPEVSLYEVVCYAFQPLDDPDGLRSTDDQAMVQQDGPRGC